MPEKGLEPPWLPERSLIPLGYSDSFMKGRKVEFIKLFNDGIDGLI